MTKEQVGGFIRAVLGAVAGYIAGKGLIPIEVLNEVVAGATLVGVAVWSYFSKK
jgi:hypothetical protein